MEAAAKRATDSGALIVAAGEDQGVRWLPGSLSNAVPVKLDWACPREAYRITGDRDRTVLAASGYPREIPGVSRERNLKGISFAVANATGFVARACEACPGRRDASRGGRASAIIETLASGATQATPSRSTQRN